MSKQAAVWPWPVLTYLALTPPTLLHCMNFCSSPAAFAQDYRQHLQGMVLAAAMLFGLALAGALHDAYGTLWLFSRC